MAGQPAQPTPPATGQRAVRQFMAGLGLGLMPLLAALFLYPAAIIATIVCLSITRVRSVGYGLLAAILASPVIFAIGCNVILS
jgi:uncharacterized membrane protein YgaE (UPF0421/DUF939 family)